MKTKIYFCFLPAAFSLCKMEAQILVTNNFGISTNYVGWKNTMSGTSLKIKTTTDDPITFHTNTVTNIMLDIFSK